MLTQKRLTENFESWEFDCKCGCGLNNIRIDFVRKLQAVRYLYGKGMPIRSGCRCETHNENEGGTDTSDHLFGLGADIECALSMDRYILIPLLCLVFPRVGVAKSFIHAGMYEGNPQNVFWVY